MSISSCCDFFPADPLNGSTSKTGSSTMGLTVVVVVVVGVVVMVAVKYDKVLVSVCLSFALVSLRASSEMSVDGDGVDEGRTS